MPTVAKGTTLNADPDNALEVRDPTTYYGRPDKEVLTVILYLLEEGEFRPDMREILGARYFGPGDELPPMRPCCIAKACDAFKFQHRAFFR